MRSLTAPPSQVVFVAFDILYLTGPGSVTHLSLQVGRAPLQCACSAARHGCAVCALASPRHMKATHQPNTPPSPHKNIINININPTPSTVPPRAPARRHPDGRPRRLPPWPPQCALSDPRPRRAATAEPAAAAALCVRRGGQREHEHGRRRRGGRPGGERAGDE